MARRHDVEVTDEQWERIKPHLPKPQPNRKGGRPRADDRACFEGILWVLRSGARWRDLPDRYPSPSTCWRRLTEWEAEGVLETIWHAFLDTLDERGLVDWDEVLIDGTFAPAKKRGDKVGQTKRGKGTKLVVVADGQGIPVACLTASASPAEVTLAEEVLDQVPTGQTPTPLVADRGYDSDKLRKGLLAKGWELVCPHRRGRKRKPTQDGRKLRRYRRRWKIERTISWLHNYRRLVVRYDYSNVYQAFILMACIMICLRRF